MMQYVYIYKCEDESLRIDAATDISQILSLRQKLNFNENSNESYIVYFEIFNNHDEADRKLMFLNSLSQSDKENIISSKKGFICIFEKEKTLIKIPSGIHYITSPIKITGSNIDIIGEENATLRACAPIKTHWNTQDGKIFYAEVEGQADALYVNGKKYIMARYPKYNPDIQIFGGYSSDCMSCEKVKEWKSPAGGYIHAMHSHYWGGYSYKITGKDANDNLIYEGGWQNNRQMGMHNDYRYVENIFEEMTCPGEWFFDEKQKRVYVIPCSDDDLSTAEIVINSGFFSFTGCENISVSGITFERSARTFMETKEPLLRSDWTIYRGGAVYINNCKNVSVTQCTFDDIGSNGVFVDGKNVDIKLSKSHFHNIGASAVCFVGNSDSVRNPLFEYNETQSIDDIDLSTGPKSDNYPRECAVEDCLIERIGCTEKQATGVEISMAYKISVINTSIYNTSRAGINISEGTFGGHLIDGCDIFDTVKETGDHGSFNSWGRDRFWNLQGVDNEDIYKYAFLDCIEPTVIRNSRFRCDRGWDIDLDDGSSNYEIYNNLCLNGGIKLREGFGRHVHHNITVNNSVHVHVWYPNSGDIVEENIVFEPYKPILMEVKWGERFDRNILHTPGIQSPVHANQLADLSNMDEHSICVDCGFKNPIGGDYTLTTTYIKGFESFPSEFGVRYQPLKKIAKQPELPIVSDDFLKETGMVIEEIFGMKIKNIETDGEMSTFGTSGHDGVIVVSNDKNSELMQKNLLANDVIIHIGDTDINSVSDLKRFTKEEILSSSITVIRSQTHIMIS